MRSPASSDRGDRRGDAGHAAVELALALPLVCLVAFGVVQVAVIARDQLAVTHTAREAARAAAVGADPVGAATASARDGPLPGLTVEVHGDGASVTVTVSAVDHTDVPLIGWLLPDVTVGASATMAVEPP